MQYSFMANERVSGLVVRGWNIERKAQNKWPVIPLIRANFQNTLPLHHSLPVAVSFFQFLLLDFSKNPCLLRIPKTQCCECDCQHNELPPLRFYILGMKPCFKLKRDMRFKPTHLPRKAIQLCCNDSPLGIRLLLSCWALYHLTQSKETSII